MKILNKYILAATLLFAVQYIWAQGPVLTATDACGVSASLGIIDVGLGEMNNYPYTFVIEQQQLDGEFEELPELQQEISAGTDAFSFEDIEVGQYRISATDGCGCKWGGLSMLHAGLNYNECLVTIEENCCSWTIESSRTNTSCEGNVGSISIVISGGSGIYDIVWVGYPEWTDQSSLTNLASGIYTAEITDFNGECSETLTFNIKKLTNITGIAAPNDFAARNVQYQDNSFGSESTIKVEIPGDRKISASLYNLSGTPVRSILNNQVMTTGTHNIDVDVSDLYDGLYILVGQVSCPDDDGEGKVDTDIGVKTQD